MSTSIVSAGVMADDRVVYTYAAVRVDLATDPAAQTQTQAPKASKQAAGGSVRAAEPATRGARSK